MKRTILKSMMVALGVLLSVHANADENGALIDGVYYNLVTASKTATVTNGSTPYTGAVTIPASVTYGDVDYDVTTIAMEAFKGCTGLTSVNIPSSVTSIGSQAFSYCSGLLSVSIPDGVTVIGDEAFYNCTSLASVVIGNDVKTIGDRAFWCCSNMTELTLGNHVETIGSQCFSSCSRLTSVAIPRSFSYFGERAFEYCSSLKAVHITDLAAWCGVNDSNTNSYLSNPLGLAQHLYLNGSEVKDLVVPTGVKTIGRGAFKGCSGLRTVTIPSSVTTIDGGAFSSCSNLVTVNIEGDGTTIGRSAFYYCRAMTSVRLSGSIASIGTDAFSDCSSLSAVHISDLAAWCQMSIGGGYANPLVLAHRLYLNGTEVKDVVVPNSVTNINDGVFSGCTSLQTVSIPNTVTSIGGNAFSECSNLTSVNIPNSVTSIGNNAFDGCSAIASVNIPAGVTSIGKSAFSGCETLASVNIADITAWNNIAFGDEKANPLYYAPILKLNGEEVTKLVIPEGISSINNYTFQNWKNLQSIVIGNSVTSIGEGAFRDCTSLVSATIGSSVTSVGKYAFYGCTGLQNLVVGNSVDWIGDQAFYNCSDLRSIVVVKGNKKYDSRDNCNAIIVTNTNTLQTGCRNTVIPKTVTALAAGAFYGCTGLTYINIPNSVTTFDLENSRWRTADRIFKGCTNLKEVEYHGANIPYGLFYMNSSIVENLEKIVLGEEVTSIESSAFRDCKNVQMVVSYIQEPFAFGGSAFDFNNTYNICKLIVPAGTRDAYIAMGWTENVFKGGIEEMSSNSFAVADKTVNHGSTITIPIEMNNVDVIGAFQFDVVLPEGVTWSKCTLTNRKDDHILSAKKQATGNYRVTCLSMSDATFSGTSGAVANLELKVDEQLLAGIYKLNIKNIELTTENGDAVHPLDVNATLMVNDFILGDTNGDGSISITDAVMVISHVLGNDPEGFVSNAADMNDSGDITITDAVAIIKIVLNGQNGSAKMKGFEEEVLDPQ